MTLPLMLFAAGFGTRMGALTADRPKPLIEVAGRALIDHALDLTTGVDLSPVVVNLHYLPEMIEAHLNGHSIETLRETPDILETGGGLRNALPLLGAETVMTLNTDAVWSGPNPLTQLIAAWDPARMDALLLCVPVERTRGHTRPGDFRIEADGQIVRGAGTIYAGVQILNTALLHDVAERAFSLNVVWNQMAERNRLFGLEYPGWWCDVGNPDGITAAEDMLAEQHV